ncbi:MAG: hypothetical protein M0010_13460, partial [Actinomycetota bacterium]|nr:hypothetical protein [Actinomycetota bacterium]
IMAAVSVVGIGLTLVALPEPKGQTLESASAEIAPEPAVAAEPASEQDVPIEPAPELPVPEQLVGNVPEESPSPGPTTADCTEPPTRASSVRA